MADNELKLIFLIRTILNKKRRYFYLIISLLFSIWVLCIAMNQI
jgi:hypothetical protein